MKLMTLTTVKFLYGIVSFYGAYILKQQQSCTQINTIQAESDRSVLNSIYSANIYRHSSIAPYLKKQIVLSR